MKVHLSLISSLLLRFSLLFSVYSAFGQDPLNDVSKLNTDHVEYAPSISADGTTMVYQSDQNGKYELYESKLVNKVWSKGHLLKGKINSYGDSTDLIGGPSLSYDGNFVYFFASFAGGKGIEDLYFSEREGSAWGTPINMGAPINSKEYEGFPSISSDGQSLYFMRINKAVKSTTCYTMMVAHKNDKGHWMKPEKLPSPINTGCEKFPRIMPDNKTLLFSSKRSSTNDFKLYQTQLKHDGTWSNPVALDYTDSDGQEYFATISSFGKQIYLSSLADGQHSIQTHPVPKHLAPMKVTIIKGHTSTKSGQPIAADLRVIDHHDKVVAQLTSNHTDGSFTLVLPAKHYNIKVSAAGYHSIEEPLVVHHSGNGESVKKDFQLTAYRGKGMVRAVDAITKTPIEATYEVINTKDNSSIVVDQASFDVAYQGQYLVKVTHSSYLPIEKTLIVESSDIETYVVKMSLQRRRPKMTFEAKDLETKESIPFSLLLRSSRAKTPVFRGMIAKDSTFEMDFKTKYIVFAISKNYLFSKGYLDFSGKEYFTEETNTIFLQRIKPGAKLTLDEVLFESNSASIEKSSYDELAAVYKFLKYNKSIKVEIAAHTDHVGSNEQNLKLSEDRAVAVVNFLISKGIPSSRIVGKGYGEAQPIASNHHADGRAKNRRVEFKILATE